MKNNSIDALVRLEEICTLPQVRGNGSEYHYIVELGDSIAASGLLHRPTVWQPSRRQYKNYCRLVRELFGSSSRRFPRWRIGMFVLLAGHRRIEACTLLRGDQDEPSNTFKHRFPGGNIPVNVYSKATSAEDALCIQVAENTGQSPVHPSRTAKAITGLYRFLNHLPTVKRTTQKEFARRVGLSPRKVSEALRFCELPLDVQEEVAKRTVSWGCAMELARLQRKILKARNEPRHCHRVDEVDIEQLVRVFAALGCGLRKRAVLRVKVDEYLEYTIGGQGDLFGEEFQLTPDKVVEHLLTQEGRRTLLAALSYLRGILAAIGRQWTDKPRIDTEARTLRDLLETTMEMLTAFLNLPEPKTT